MEEVQRWLVELESKASPKSTNELRLIEALEQIIGLSTIRGDNKCNENSHAIPLFVFVTYKCINKISKESSDEIDRVGRIVRHFTLKHAQDCLLEYPRMLLLKYDTLDREIIECVKAFATESFHTFDEISQLTDSYRRYMFEDLRSNHPLGRIRSIFSLDSLGQERKASWTRYRYGIETNHRKEFRRLQVPQRQFRGNRR